MNKKDTLDIVKKAFHHMFVEENIQVGNISVLLYFPTMSIALLDLESKNAAIVDDPNIEDMDSLLIKKELGAKTVYLDMNEEDFNVGFVINDIITTAEMLPSENSFSNRDAQL